MIPRTYPYGEEFQRSLLALMARDPRFMAEFRDILNPSYFEHEYLVIIARNLLELFDQYGATPNRRDNEARILEFCSRYYRDGLESDRKRKEVLFNVLESIYSIDLGSVEYLKDRVIRFGKNQALKIAVIEAKNILDNPQIEEDEIDSKIESAFRKALSVGQQTGSGFDFARDALNIRNLLKVGIYDLAKRVETGLPSLDYFLMGGIAPGELGVIYADTNKGKSGFLANLAKSAMKRGKAVIYYTFELADIDIFIRMIAATTGYSIREIVTGEWKQFSNYDNRDLLQQSHTEESFFGKVKEVLNGGPLRMKMYYFKPMTISVSGIRSHLSKLYSSEGFKPNLICLDYADKLMPSRITDNTNLNMGDIYNGLIGLGKDFEAGVWTASQVQRGSTYGKDINTSDPADAIRKSTDSDIVLSINATEEEFKNGMFRLNINKVRRSEGAGEKIVCYYQRETQSISEARDQYDYLCRRSGRQVELPFEHSSSSKPDNVTISRPLQPVPPPPPPPFPPSPTSPASRQPRSVAQIFGGER